MINAVSKTSPQRLPYVLANARWFAIHRFYSEQYDPRGECAKKGDSGDFDPFRIRFALEHGTPCQYRQYQKENAAAFDGPVQVFFKREHESDQHGGYHQMDHDIQMKFFGFIPIVSSIRSVKGCFRVEGAFWRPFRWRKPDIELMPPGLHAD